MPHGPSVPDPPSSPDPIDACAAEWVSSSRGFMACSDMSLLDVFMCWAYDVVTSSLSVVFVVVPPSPNGWVTWGFIPIGDGMDGTHVLLAPCHRRPLVWRLHRPRLGCCQGITDPPGPAPVVAGPATLGPIAAAPSLPVCTTVIVPVDAFGWAATGHAGTAWSHHVGPSSPFGAASDGELMKSVSA
jgi:hypothetical protein